MDYADARRRMVDSQLRPSSITDFAVLAAMLAVPRERFVPASRRPLAYIDDDIEIAETGEGRRFLMEPMPFARLAQLAAISEGDLVLDIGAATGYGAAVMARLADAVVALESDAGLAAEASATLVDLGIDNVAVVQGALAAGYPGQGPYDVILIEGSVAAVPEALFAQLREGGRLVAVVREGPIGKARLWRRVGAGVSAATAFDANVEPLPGFEAAPSFVF